MWGKMIKARINRIIDSSVVDGPGNRTAIFFQGCNFNCKYCHNPETISNSITACKSSDSFEISELSVEEVVGHVKNNLPFITGITTSGGECTLQKDFLRPMYMETRKLGLTNFVDSNGSLRFSDYPEFVESFDAVMLDIKSIDKEEHIKLTSASNEIVLENARYLASIGKLFEIRTVTVDGYLNNMRTVDEITRMLKDYQRISPIRYKIIRFRPFGVRDEFKYMKAPSEEEMLNLKAIANKNGFEDVLLV
jgi:pyruvate formate lyase activating enzyme